MLSVLIVGAAMAEPLPELPWFVVNDTVMGGVSSGEASPLKKGQVRFEGELSLDNNGGFVSLRTRPSELGLDDVSALTVKVRGDGRTWNVNVYRSDVPLRAGSYRASLPTVAGEITELTLPLSAFSPTSFGRDVRGAPALDANPGRIDQLGFLLGDKNPGPFALEVLSVGVERERRARTGNPSQIAMTLTRAVQAGVPAFNAGDVAGCRDLYREALAGIVESDTLTDGEQRIVREALADSADQRALDGAWTLRYAIDTVLASVPAS